MRHPDQALERIKQVACDSSTESDIRALAVLFLDLEQHVIKPLRQQVVVLERRVATLESTAVKERNGVVASVERSGGKHIVAGTAHAL
jgi:hypothetical protein